MNRLIDLELVHRLNNEQPCIAGYLREGFSKEPLLRDVLIKQVAEAEADLLCAIDRLMGKYLHAMTSALAVRPSPEFDALMSSLPNITTEP